MPTRFNPPGFTLLELIVSLTITTLLVLVIHTAFSMGARIWERQGEGTEDIRREEVALRLLQEDVAAMRPYSMLWERGPFFFFGGGEHTLYYVTTNGFGAGNRDHKRLFFTCLFLERDEQSNWGLHLYKSAVPAPDLVRAVQDYRNLTEGLHAGHSPPEWLRQDAVFIFGGLSSAGFSFSDHPFVSFAGSEEDGFSQDLFTNLKEDALDREHWVANRLPAQIQFQYAIDDSDPVQLLLVPQWGRP